METILLPLSDPQAEARIVACLDGGGLVAIPTETVYGLAGDACSGTAVARIFEAKGRPSFNPLIAHVSDIEMAQAVACFDDFALELARRFWPGPLTLVLPLADGSPVHPLLTAGLPTVAVRMPEGPAGNVIARLGRPLAAPSANRSGRVSPTSASHVLRSLDGRIEIVADGGATRMGVESTILKPEGEEVLLLRPGALAAEEVEAAIGRPLRRSTDGAIQAPGQLRSHYAPHGAVRLDVREVEAGEHLIAFGPDLPDGAERASAVINLSLDGDLREAATNLFSALSEFDGPHVARIAVAPIPHHGLGAAINDRLARAAAPRDDIHQAAPEV